MKCCSVQSPCWNVQDAGQGARASAHSNDTLLAMTCDHLLPAPPPLLPAPPPLLPAPPPPLLPPPPPPLLPPPPPPLLIFIYLYIYCTVFMYVKLNK